jgi:hypothetical protein
MAAKKKSKVQDSFTVELEKSKSTKGTHVFNDSDDDAPIRSLYISKSGISDEAETIRVTVEVIA